MAAFLAVPLIKFLPLAVAALVAVAGIVADTGMDETSEFEPVKPEYPNQTPYPNIWLPPVNPNQPEQNGNQIVDGAAVTVLPFIDPEPWGYVHVTKVVPVTPNPEPDVDLGDVTVPVSSFVFSAEAEDSYAGVIIASAVSAVLAFLVLAVTGRES